MPHTPTSRRRQTPLARFLRDLPLARPTPWEDPIDGAGWLHEIKFDGYRLIAANRGGHVSLYNRSRDDWTDRFPSVVDALKGKLFTDCVLDGELVVMGDNGLSSFRSLCETIQAGGGPYVYWAFDLLWRRGRSLLNAPLSDRKNRLEELIGESGVEAVQYTDHVVGNGHAFFQQCRKFGVKGVVSKRADSAYPSGLTKDWRSLDCVTRQTLIVGGYTLSTVDRNLVGTLVVGLFDQDGQLRFHGQVGTGFSEGIAAQLCRDLGDLRCEETPFEDLRQIADRRIKWVAPSLLVDLEHSGRTHEGYLLSPVFHGVRDDRNVDNLPPCDRHVRDNSSDRKRPRRVTTSTVKFTNPSRVLFPGCGLSKRGLAEFYTRIADWILPHIVDRPITLVRSPSGQKGWTFYQKHDRIGTLKHLRRIEIEGKDKTEEHLAVKNLDGLLELVQHSVVELHVWNARIDRLDRPDRILFDLDPDESVPWAQVVGLALRLRAKLTEFGLKSYVKTTGGKGLHLCVPIVRRYTWDRASAFAKSIANQLVAENPELVTTNASLRVRKGRIYIDLMRNRRGANTVAAYSTRATPNATVSVPIDWDELSPALHSDHFTVDLLVSRMRQLAVDPWAELLATPQSFTRSVHNSQ